MLSSIETDYETVKTIKHSERGSVSLLQNKQNGTRFIFRHYRGNGEVYRKLLGISCPNLPQIMETAERDGMVAVLEEYIQGDSLAYLLEGALFSPAEARKITRQLCNALWVLHQLGAVHRDIKPENVIIQGSEAILIDFDASRIFKSDTNQDTQILGTTGYAAPEQYGIAQTDERAGHLFSWGAAEYHAHGKASVQRTGKRPLRPYRAKMHHGKSGKTIQKRALSDGGALRRE